MARRRKTSYRSRSSSARTPRRTSSYRTRSKRRYASSGGARTIRLQIVQQAPQPMPMAVPGVGMTMPAGPPGKSPF